MLAGMILIPILLMQTWRLTIIQLFFLQDLISLKINHGVLVVSRWILARLRYHTFYSLEDLNKNIADLLKELNHKPFQKIPGSRHSQFMEFEKPTLLPLPLQPYSYARFKRLRVGADYHIEVDRHYYSVPHQYARQEVEVRISAHTIEVFGQGKRIPMSGNPIPVRQPAPCICYRLIVTIRNGHRKLV